MGERSDVLQSFVDATFAAYDELAEGDDARRALRRLRAKLRQPGKEQFAAGSRLAACDQLAPALSIGTTHASLRPTLQRFEEIEPRLAWHRRHVNDPTGSANCYDGHANAMIIGPGGIEERDDLWLGVTVLAPNVRYPDHDHAPEEVYLVFTPGDFLQGDTGWITPGIGGTIYNTPQIRHAMRSGNQPLLAFWALPIDDVAMPV